MMLTIDVSIDGNQVACVIGDMPICAAGFGDTLSEALKNLVVDVEKIERGEFSKDHEKLASKINSLSYLASGIH
jgi:hypothetical protein